jgi:hypothetical protein
MDVPLPSHRSNMVAVAPRRPCSGAHRPTRLRSQIVPSKMPSGLLKSDVCNIQPGCSCRWLEALGCSSDGDTYIPCGRSFILEGT